MDGVIAPHAAPQPDDRPNPQPAPVVRCATRQEWRAWLAAHFEDTQVVWFALPTKASGGGGVSYNDAVEEALCFGWIDSKVRTVGAERLQRFTPRRPGSTFSQPNKERLRWLYERGLVHESVREDAERVLAEEFESPADIMQAIRDDADAWAHYQGFPEGYKRIRIAFIDGARGRPDEFAKRLNNFLAKTRDGRLIPGYGGVDKYY